MKAVVQDAFPTCCARPSGCEGPGWGCGGSTSQGASRRSGATSGDSSPGTRCSAGRRPARWRSTHARRWTTSLRSRAVSPWSRPGRSEDLSRSGQLYDVILVDVEVQSLSAVRRVLAPTGTLIPNSGRGGPWIGPLGRWTKARVRSLFTRQTLRPFASTETHRDLLVLKELTEAGAVTPVVGRTYPLSDAAEALAYVGAGHTRGKIVVTV